MFPQLKDGISKLAKTVKTKEISQKELRKLLRELEAVLIRNEVAPRVASDISKRVAENMKNAEKTRFTSGRGIITTAIRDAITAMLNVAEPIDIIKRVQDAKSKGTPLVIMFLGVNGTGKTTSIAKVGKMLLDNKLTVVLAAADTFRAGSIQQLQKHADKLKIRVISQDYGADAAAVAFDAVEHANAKGIDAVLIDTAGRMQTNINLMNELKKINRVVAPDLRIFVGDALAGNDMVSQAETFDSTVGIDGSILTKVDADAKGGGAVSIARVTGKPVSYSGIGQGYKHLAIFDAKEFVEKIVPPL